MDAVKFINEVQSMCESFSRCGDCPLTDKLCYEGINITCPEELVNIVETWSEKHSIVTNAQKFKEVFGIGISKLLILAVTELDFLDYSFTDWCDAEYKTPEEKRDKCGG